MGRQVNFFLSNQDQLELMHKIDRMQPVSAVLEPLTGPELRTVPLQQVAIWHPAEPDAVLFRTEDQALVVTRLSGNMKDYVVDFWKSPIVQFSRCIQREKSIQRGRFYYLAKDVDDDGTIVEKSKEFVSWATRLFNLVKKNCTRIADGDYIGPHAQSLVDRGYGLERA